MFRLIEMKITSENFLVFFAAVIAIRKQSQNSLEMIKSRSFHQIDRLFVVKM